MLTRLPTIFVTVGEKNVVNLREWHKIFYQNKRQPEPLLMILYSFKHLPRSMWRLGRILELINGHDDRVRGAIVRTQNNSDLRRPINRLYPMETIPYILISWDIRAD